MVIAQAAGSRCTECAAAFGPIGTCEYCGASRVPTEMDDDDVGSFYFEGPRLSCAAGYETQRTVYFILGRDEVHRRPGL
jgi:hypothetical protein